MTQRPKKWVHQLAGWIILLLLGYVIVVYARVRHQAWNDEAQSADFIVVLGAAQYNGRPSPVLKARLDHAIHLFSRKYAPQIITTGGHGLDRNFTEAGVARDYLMKQGIAESAIQVAPNGDTTLQSIRSIKNLLPTGHAKSCIVVSDGFHLFRLKTVFQDEGIQAYVSPDPDSPIESSSNARFWHSLREVMVYTAYEIGIRK